MADETLFGWVHLSDIHFGHGDTGHRWDQQLVLETLKADIRAQRAERTVDAVLVTGDIAYSGGGLSPDEYKRAANWLREVAAAARVPQSQVYLVPGNHDVNRGGDKADEVQEVFREVWPAPPAKGTSIDDLLKAPSKREVLARRMIGYLDFSAAFGPWAQMDVVPPPIERLSWVCSLDARGGLKVRLIGLNTALLSKNGDRGKLELGKASLAEAILPEAAPNELLMVLSHHPFRDWLSDASYADGWIRNHAHVHLSGHVHEADTEEARSGAGGSFVRVVAGAAHGEAMPEAWIPASHGYSFGEVRLEGGKTKVRIFPRLWSEPNKRFVLDVHHVPEKLGYAEHDLRVTLGASSPSAAVSAFTASGSAPDNPRGKPIDPTAPIEVFVFYSPKDEELKEELDTHLAGLTKKGAIKSVSARSIEMGEDEASAIDAHMESARVFLVLVSPAFLASDFIDGPELARALERNAKKEALVIPIYLKPCDWKATTTLGRLTGLPRDGVPISKRDHDEALMQVAVELRKLVEGMRRPKA